MMFSYDVTDLDLHDALFSNFVSSRYRLLAGVSASLVALLSAQPAVAASQPTPSTLVSVCSGVKLPPSVVTGIIAPVLIGTVDPLETTVNGTLTALGPLPGIIGLPSPLSFDTTGLLTTAASGSDISLSVVSQNGTLVGPSSQCDASASSYTLDTPAGVSIGGNQITGLGATGQQAVAGEINSIAIGNNAATNALATNSVAIGTGASVAATGANSVALGAGSIADRPNTVSVGAVGSERVIANVAAGTLATDAVNLGQLTAATQNAVQYDDSTHSTVTFDGVGGTTLTNVKAGAVTATSTDAVNGSQLYAVQTQVDANTTAIANLTTTTNNNTTAITNLTTQVNANTTAVTNLTTQVNANTTAVTNLQVAVENGAIGPVQYSNPATPTVPNGGTPTNDVTLVGAAAGGVGLHNVADGVIGAGSTDAVNGGQLYEAILGANPNAVLYDDSSHTAITLNSGGAATTIHNVAAGTAATDAVNVGQLNAVSMTTLNSANSYTDLKFNLLDQQVARVDRDARAGTSAALAAAGMPQAMDPGRTMIAGGVGTYRGRVGFAIGGSYRAPNGQSAYKVGVTYDSSSHIGANAGFGFEF
ncbi:YadA-like family protein [Sphingomonas sp. ASV193]|uniref:YadA family autotransporter adhesin n=1 Tax=Sphingomonas sp. ASV193 TaxID=3144405 RepID=UPI0032E891EC